MRKNNNRERKTIRKDNIKIEKESKNKIKYERKR